jgi:anti-anti-sigma factor
MIAIPTNTLGARGDAVGTAFALTVTTGPGLTTIAIRGELDIASIELFSGSFDLVRSRRGCSVVIDCTELTFIDASGLGQLARLIQLVGNGHPLTIVSPSAMMLKLLDITGMADYLRIEISSRTN